MSSKRASRTSEIEIDRCLSNFDSTYDLILTAARRTRKLQKNADPWGPMVTPVDALLEAQAGKLHRDDYMRPNNGMSAEDYYTKRYRNSKKELPFV